MIDHARIRDLKIEIGDDDFLEVVELFLEEADEAISQLSEPIDLSAVEARLHFLKGSALNLGLTVLAALCQIGEKSAAAGNASLVDLAAVADVYSSSKAALIASLSQTAAA